MSECKCDWCQKYSPMIKKIEGMLSEPDKTQFNEMMEYLFSKEADADYYEMKYEELSSFYNNLAKKYEESKV